MIVEIDTRIEL